MNIEDFKKPEKLIYYSFVWSEARMFIAAVALFIGGVPPIIAWNPFSGLYGIISPLLTLCWIISGVASAYLLYEWNKRGRMLFGRKETKDVVAFLVMIVSGFNLGIAGMLKINIGMSISTNQVLFGLVGILYILSAGYLYVEWKRRGRVLI